MSEQIKPGDSTSHSATGYAAETVETLRACRDHWKVSWQNERENVIRLRKIITIVHGPCCECDDCQLVKQHNEKVSDERH